MKFLYISLLILFCSSIIKGQDGKLDNSFSGDGKQTNVIGSGDCSASDLLVLPDGKFIVVGYGDNNGDQNMAVVKYNSDGSFDNTFNGNGKLFINTNGRGAGESILLLPNGNILIGGFNDKINNDQIVLVMIDQNGNLINEFSSDGILIIDNLMIQNEAFNSILYADERIYISGNSYNGLNTQAIIIALDIHGEMITSFGEDGIKTVDVNGKSTISTCMIYLNDSEKLLIAGRYQTEDGNGHQLFISKFNKNGEIDTTFHTAGFYFDEYLSLTTSEITALVEQNDNKLVVVGKVQFIKLFAIRLLENGNPDSTFGENGVAIPDFGNEITSFNSVIIQPDNKLLIAGGSTDDNPIYKDFAVVRLLPNGEKDNTFSDDGIVLTNMRNGNYDDEIISSSLQSDGKLLTIGGSTDINFTSAFAIARYTTGIEITSVKYPESLITNPIIFPNPVAEEISLKFSLKEAQEITIRYISLNGSYVSSKVELGMYDKGDHSTSLNLPDNLVSGMYTLQISNPNGVIGVCTFQKI